MKHKLRQLLLATLLFTLIAGWIGCKHSSSSINTDPKELKGNITISGAFALYPLTVKWAEEFKKEYPNIKINT